MKTTNRFSLDTLVIASRNKGKIKEFKELLSNFPINISPQPIGLDIVENGNTFAENARIKALKVSTYTGQFSLADDSGLCIESLLGAPGIFSARYGETDQEKIERVLNELSSHTNRNAYFMTSLCIASPEGRIFLEVEGKCEGIISTTPRGSNGFGYDPIFQVNSNGMTFAEMTQEEKKVLSHRGKAFKNLIPSLKEVFGLEEIK